MPLIRTDDGPRRLRAVWLGPRGFRWYWTWTYVQWFATFLAIVTCSIALSLVVWLVSADVKIAVIIGPMWGAALGYLGVREAMKHVDYDRPIRYWRATLRGEWRDSSRSRTATGSSGWWIASGPPRMMSRYALAYLGLSTTKHPERMERTRPAFPRVVVGPADAHGSPWAVDLDAVPTGWPRHRSGSVQTGTDALAVAGSTDQELR